jgi:hypothetical protein
MPRVPVGIAAVENAQKARRLTSWQLAWVALLAVYLVLSLIWLCDLHPHPWFRWFNENYEYLYTQGPPLALSFSRSAEMRSMWLVLYGIGTLCLLGLGYMACRAVRMASRVVLSLLFMATWAFWGTIASAPWY